MRNGIIMQKYTDFKQLIDKVLPQTFAVLKKYSVLLQLSEQLKATLLINSTLIPNHQPGFFFLRVEGGDKSPFFAFHENRK